MQPVVDGDTTTKGWSGYKAAEWATETYQISVSAKTLYFLKKRGQSKPAERRGPQASFTPDEFRLIGEAIASYIGIRQVNGDREACNKSVMAICQNLLSTRKDIKCVKTFWDQVKSHHPHLLTLSKEEIVELR